MPGMALQLVSGIVAGAVCVVVVSLPGLELGPIVVALGLGPVYGIVLMIGAMVFWMRIIIGMEPDRGMMTMFDTVHVMDGVVLGGFLGADLIA